MKTQRNLRSCFLQACRRSDDRWQRIENWNDYKNMINLWRSESKWQRIEDWKDNRRKKSTFKLCNSFRCS